MGPFWAVFLLASCALAQGEFRFTEAARGFTSPVDIQFPPDRSGRMFVVEQAGRIQWTRQGALQPTPFLDIRARVRSGGEQGLLAMALSPRFRDTGRFYVHYTDLAGNTVIARYTVAPGAETADASTEQIILQVQQPASNHNGGTITFGPDGYLYIGLGDGGGSNDQFQNAQNRRSLLGKILRIDVEGAATPYGIPPDNPFVNDASYRPEIWDLGLRNPWRFSFDRETGDLWIGDVGQNRAEEVDFEPARLHGGVNYGWPIMEGFRCRVGDICADDGLTLPVHEYTRESGDQSITGGYLYRGLAISNLPAGSLYFFADYVSGRVWALQPSAPGTRIPIRGPGLNVSTFGQDANGELYIAGYGNGIIYRLERTITSFLGNGASFAPGLAPGMIATAFVPALRADDQVIPASSLPLPTTLGGVEVRVNGTPVPLYAVARTQVNFQVPWDFANTASLEFRRNGQVVFTMVVPGSAAPFLQLPGVFSYSGSREAIIIRNSDYTLAESLQTGVDYFLYASGLGDVSNRPPLGEAASANPLSVLPTLPRITIGGVECQVSFGGLAPGLVGVYQVNFRLGQGVRSGAQRLELSSGGVVSNGSTVFVQ